MVHDEVKKIPAVMEKSRRGNKIEREKKEGTPGGPKKMPFATERSNVSGRNRGKKV